MRREWTKREENFVLRNYEYISNRAIAKKLKRTEGSVRHKALKLGLNTYVGEGIRGKQLARCFNSDICVVKGWIRLGLPAIVENHNGVNFYSIKAEQFWEWAEQHRSRIPWHHYEENSLPPEPAWVKECVQESQYKCRSRAPLTEMDLTVVRYGVRAGKTNDEMGAILHRSPNAVNHIRRKLRKEGILW